jgi:hypothetical protein
LKRAGGGISISSRGPGRRAETATRARRTSATMPSTVCPGTKGTSIMIVQRSGTYGGSARTYSSPGPPTMPSTLRRGTAC